ncbi:MAG: GntR family transcriptional regulator [Proteobacteria bacterium]|nr:GntR family transcriptional regulator [Pseudomonadota bacterium]
MAEAHAIFEARIAIECEITRMVAAGATRETLAPLRKNVDEETEYRMQGRIREAVRSSGELHILLGYACGNENLAGIVRQLVARTSLVVSLYENQSTMSCWHDDHGDFIKLLEAHKMQPAVTLMRKHLLYVEESLNLDSHARGPLDLRRIYAPSGKV